MDTITDDESYLASLNDADEPPTPINESRELLFPITASGAATPTPQSINMSNPFGSRVDEFNGSAMNLQQRSLKSYLHTFDRRNSDTNYLLGRRSSGERINLADEIKKLSDHLLMLAQINTKFNKESDREKELEARDEQKEKKSKTKKTKDAETGTATKKSAAANKTNGSATKEVNAKSSSKTSKTSTTSSKISTSPLTSNATATPTTTNSFFNNLNPGKSRTSTLSWRLQQSIEETPKLNSNNNNNNSTSTITPQKSSVNTITTGNAQSNAERFQEAASIKRAKFRINQMSRDVPVGLPNTHQAVNLEEAANNTKDCLLHLLEKYNESKTRNPLGRHQSIGAIDWNVSDNLEYRSMSSINAFFQRHNNNGNMVKQLQAQLKEKTGGTN